MLLALGLQLLSDILIGQTFGFCLLSLLLILNAKGHFSLLLA